MSSQRSPREEMAGTLLAEMTRGTGLAVLFSQAIADRVGLNPTDLEALEILLRGGPMTAGRLAEATGLTSGAITGVVDRLARKGYARREPDPADRRRVIVHAHQGTATRDLLSLYGGMREETGVLVSRLTDDELASILAFFQAANRIAAEQIERVRAGAGASPGDSAS